MSPSAERAQRGLVGDPEFQAFEGVETTRARVTDGVPGAGPGTVPALSWLALGLLVVLSGLRSAAQVAPSAELALWSGIAVVGACGLALVRLGAVRSGAVAVELSRCWAAILLTLLGSIYLTPWTGPLADRWLGWPDGGVVVVDSAAWLRTHGLWAAAVAGYDSGHLALALVLLWLGRDPKARRIADAFVVCGVVGLAAYVLAPAAGAGAGCAAAGQPGWTELRNGAGWTYGAAIPGLIAAPSFHAVSAQLLARAVWPDRRLRPLAALWWAVLVGTAIPVGGHYLLDLAAGIGLAEVAWRVTR